MPVGFVGLGVMGQPMALNLARAGVPLQVWNRSPGRSGPVADAGATVAPTLDALFGRCDPVILMLANAAAVDAVLDRHGPAFAPRVAGRLLVTMGTTAPAYSRALGEAVRQAGGRHVECPVSGSRVPAESAQLVAMAAGAPEDVAAVRQLVAPMCRASIDCGAVPGALVTKLAVNHYLITMVTGLCEATRFAAAHGLDLARFRAVLDAGPMASDVSRVKLAKLVAGDFAVQAAIDDVLMNTRLVADAACAQGLDTPLLDRCLALYERATAMGLGAQDMVAVLRAFEQDGMPSTPGARRRAAADRDPTSLGRDLEDPREG